jgi:gamma-glutamyltranspeptidase / glutathione hydrolase
MNKGSNALFSKANESTVAAHGVVATTQPLAATIGLEILKQGGNAIDAAIATAAAMTVCEPTANGIGGDAFVIIYSKGQLYGLNASGKAPASISIDSLLNKGLDSMPQFGVDAITVPGIPQAWADLQARFGSKSLSELLEPAARLAEDGYVVGDQLADMWNRATTRYQSIFTDSMFTPWFDLFAPEKQAPLAGSTWSSVEMAQTLRTIGQTNAEDFYTGALATSMARFVQAHGGYLSTSDLASHTNEWVTPISTHYKGVDVWELPPNGQGIVALQALGMLANEAHPYGDVESIHRQIEAIKLSFADGLQWVTDPAFMTLTPNDFLSPAYLKQRAGLIREHAQVFETGLPSSAGTIYLCTADNDGNMVSYIQSNFYGFGSGIVIPGTGISMQNRGFSFSLNKSHPNALAPGKRTYHTIIPGFLTKQGRALGPFGIMGGYTQPQAHLQVVMHLVDHALDPQAALDAPRWQWMQDLTIHVEPGFPVAWTEALRAKGHDVVVLSESLTFGRGQVILRLDDATYVAGTERRAEGIAAGY